MKNKITIILVAALLACLMSGCPDDRRDVDQPETVFRSPRFDLKRVETFDDFHGSYDGKRSIYLLTDKKTGQEYVGVSGVGIAELRGGKFPAEHD